MINLSSIHLSYGDHCIIDQGEFLIKSGDKIGLVGPNGAGKTSLFRLISGQEKPDEGTVSVDPGTVIGYFSQDVGEMSGKSVLEEVIAGAGKVWLIGQKLAALEDRMAGHGGDSLSQTEMEHYGEIQTEYMNLDGYDLENRAETILSGLGFATERQKLPVENFSGGWKMRIALAKILVLQPDVLLMDEPTNHLDLESIVWLEAWLKSYKGELVMTSHDREFMTRLCSKTIEVAAGTITTYTGDYDFYLTERVLRRDQQVASFKRQQAMLAKEEQFIARFGARASHAAQVQSRVKTIEKIERIELPTYPKALKIQFAACKRSGDQVLVMEDLSKAWLNPDGSMHQVFRGLTGTVNRNDRIALTGINGAGKSTLLKVITGQTDATSGKSVVGNSVNLGYFSQYSSDVLRPQSTIFEEIAERLPHASIGTIKGILGAFQFSGTDSEKKISVLSGGEKSRVILACILALPVNFLVLDEPTNHLDIQSREVLLDSLVDFDGTVMIVSHDRYFLRRLASKVFEIDSGKMRIFEGDFDYYLSKKTSS